MPKNKPKVEDLRERLLQEVPLERASVTVPEWGEVWVRELAGFEREELEDHLQRQPNRVRATYVAAHVCDEEGKRIFQWKDVLALCKLPPRILDPVFMKALEVSKMGDKQLEEEVGNSTSGPGTS